MYALFCSKSANEINKFNFKYKNVIQCNEHFNSSFRLRDNPLMSCDVKGIYSSDSFRLIELCRCLRKELIF